MQLWELRKWRAAHGKGKSLYGLVYRPDRDTPENRQLQPAKGWMEHRMRIAMLTDAL